MDREFVPGWWIPSDWLHPGTLVAFPLLGDIIDQQAATPEADPPTIVDPDKDKP